MFALKTDIQRLKPVFAFIAKPEGACVPMVSQIPVRSDQKLYETVSLGDLPSFHRPRQIELAVTASFRSSAISFSG